MYGIKTNCHNCHFKRNIPGDTHIACIKPDEQMTGDQYGIKNGWFIYPFNFDPVWRTKECINFIDIDEELPKVINEPRLSTTIQVSLTITQIAVLFKIANKDLKTSIIDKIEQLHVNVFSEIVGKQLIKSGIDIVKDYDIKDPEFLLVVEKIKEKFL